jgi:hypothetical protein
MLSPDSLLDDVQADSVTTFLQSFEEIAISSTHTLQEVVALLFDHAIAKPDLWCVALARGRGGGQSWLN